MLTLFLRTTAVANVAVGLVALFAPAVFQSLFFGHAEPLAGTSWIVWLSFWGLVALLGPAYLLAAERPAYRPGILVFGGSGKVFVAIVWLVAITRGDMPGLAIPAALFDGALGAWFLWHVGGRVATPATLAVSLALAALPIRAEAAGDPLLWRVERDGPVSHLFGTIHLGLDLDRALGAAGLAALDGAEQVFLEVDMTQGQTLDELLTLTANRATLPPGESLESLVRPATWDRLVALHRTRQPAEALDRLQPWFVAWLTGPLVVPIPEALRGPSLDEAIASRARDTGRRIMPLDTTMEHVQTLARMPRREGIAMLEELVDDPEGERRDRDELVDAYRARDDRRLRKAIGRQMRRKPALAERLLAQRNERWCNRLDRWLPDTNVFVAAGAAHMFGERGMVELLRRRGYRVRRVRTPAGRDAEPPDG